MNTTLFAGKFDKAFPARRRNVPDSLFRRNRWVRAWFDPCPDVSGMASPRKLRLLHLAVSLLPSDGTECYCEVGTFQGKSLIAALKDNPGRAGVCSDNFSEFEARGPGPNNLSTLLQNLERYGLTSRVTIFSEDFRSVFEKARARHLIPPIGVYFYDGAHDYQSQYDGIRLVEPLLADQAIVIVDDWRHAPDSNSYAEQATLRAIEESDNQWTLDLVLPARSNADRAMWWNGIGILSFQRSADRRLLFPINRFTDP